MMRRIFLTAMLVLIAFPAFAYESKCGHGPLAPIIPDGRTITLERLLAVRAEVVTFMKKSDDYQDCLAAEYRAAVQQAAQDRLDIDPDIDRTIHALGDANQREKERVAREFNSAKNTYYALHPPAPAGH